jgi:23S rRNA (pseudouridine1915-N3)-methyltransferase
MKIILLVVGKTNEKFLTEAISIFEKRLKHYISFQIEVIPELKNTKHLSIGQQKEKEAELILKQLQEGDDVILLDEKGTSYTSKGFADLLEKKMSIGIKRLVFVVGGPYGFAPKMYERAQEKISFSKMTFSHQLIRLIFVEQIYRAFTIMKGEPYHHE